MTILFNLDFETKSTCNRVCPTCLRNSHPNREAVRPWFEPNYLPENVIYDATSEALGMERFAGTVCLNYYNEPLMDERIADIAENLRRFPLKELYMHSNGDLLTEEIASNLDGKLHKIIFTLYMDDPVKTKRHEWIKSLFHLTPLVFILEPVHVPTHYSPAYPVMEMAEKHKMHTCLEPSMRIVINHRREYMLCCDDLNGNFGLGTYPEISLQAHWNRKMEMQEKLLQFGGRLNFPHCILCPRA